MSLIFLEKPNFSFIKILAIAFITVLYSFGGIFLTLLSDKYILNEFFDKNDEDLEKKSTSRHLGETTAILAFYGIVAYLGRNIIQKIPFPLDGLYGFKYSNVKEVASGALLLWILINYSPILTNKIKIIRKRFSTII
jgi:hypothetical protein